VGNRKSSLGIRKNRRDSLSLGGCMKDKGLMELRKELLTKLLFTQMAEHGELKNKYRQGLPVDTTEIYKLKRKVDETKKSLADLNAATVTVGT
jgi:hypothetical protein